MEPVTNLHSSQTSSFTFTTPLVVVVRLQHILFIWLCSALSCVLGKALPSTPGMKYSAVRARVVHALPEKVHEMDETLFSLVQMPKKHRSSSCWFASTVPWSVTGPCVSRNVVCGPWAVHTSHCGVVAGCFCCIQYVYLQIHFCASSVCELADALLIIRSAINDDDKNNKGRTRIKRSPKTTVS